MTSLNEIDPLIEEYKKYFSWKNLVKSYGSGVPVYDAMKKLGFPHSFNNSKIFDNGSWAHLHSSSYTSTSTDWTKGAKDIFVWAEENLQEQWTYSYIRFVGSFYFKNKNDMVLFMLKWAK